MRSSRHSVMDSMLNSTKNAVSPTVMPISALNIHLMRPRRLLLRRNGTLLSEGLSCIRRSSIETTLISTSVSSDSASFISCAQSALRALPSNSWAPP